AAERDRDDALARIELVATDRITRNILQQPGVIQAEADDWRVVAGDVIELRASRGKALDLERLAAHRRLGEREGREDEGLRGADVIDDAAAPSVERAVGGADVFAVIEIA